MADEHSFHLEIPLPSSTHDEDTIEIYGLGIGPIAVKVEYGDTETEIAAKIRAAIADRVRR